MNIHEKINYVEFPSSNIPETKSFFTKVFGWGFEDYGPDYVSFSNEGIDGGFFKSDLASSTSNGAALIIFYSNDLESSLQKVEEAKGKIKNPYSHFQVEDAFTSPNPAEVNSQYGQINSL